MIDSRSLGGFIGEKGALLKHKCISYEWKKPLSRLAKDHVTMLQAGKQLGCLINEQVRLLFWFDLKFTSFEKATCQRGRVVILIGQLLATYAMWSCNHYRPPETLNHGGLYRDLHG